MKYNIIYADPPWPFKNYSDRWHEEHKESRWVGKHYGTMDVLSLPVQQICEPDSVLFLWVTFPTLLLGLEVLSAWGFTYKTNAFTWIKTNKDLSPCTGMGFYTRSNAEICLLGTKGKVLPRQSHSVHSVIMSPREEHSKKPAEVRDRIVQLFGDLPRIELFARRKVDGWDSWGNEIDSDITL